MPLYDGGGDPNDWGLSISEIIMSEPYEKITQKGFKVQQPGNATFAGADAFDGQAPSPVFVKQIWSDSLIGVKNPKWRQQIREGRGATTPMTAIKKTITQTPGLFECTGNVTPLLVPSGRRKAVVVALADAPNLTIDSVGVIDATADKMAAGTYYNKVRDKMSTFKGSVFAAESVQAKRMMIDRAQRMLTKIPYFQDRLRKRWVKSRTKRGKLKTLSNSWLELQFGWLPLASDIEDAYEVLNTPVPQFKLVTAYGNSGFMEAQSLQTHAAGIANWQSETRTYQWCQVRYRGMIRARASATGSQLLDFGVGVREFLPTLWEVIPWSFAVDYFTNVSEIVNAISYASVEALWINKTTRYQRTSESVSTAWINKSGLYESTERINVPSKFTVQVDKVVRTGIASVPIPPLTFQLPKLRQVLNLTALAVSRRLRLSY